MYYKEFLRVRNAVIWLAIAMGVVSALHAALHLFIFPFLPAYSNSVSPVNIVALFAGAAVVIGGIMATIFGSTLACENDGHLELAWTKPHSRSEYATTAMLVDAAAIMVCVLMGFVALILNLGIPGMGEHVTWSGSASTANDLLRFALFPLAWYAVIVALSARLRGGGLVQGLIWPASLVLSLLAQIPFPPWHTLFGALNFVNPLRYIEYRQDSFSIHTAGDINAAIFAVFALTALVVGGWAFATMQWRRLEA